MRIDTMQRVVVFDLDDTLCREIDFLKSAYKEIAGATMVSSESIYEDMLRLYHSGDDVFAFVESITSGDMPKSRALEIYRNHKPTISFIDGGEVLLNKLKESGYIIGLITDGRSITQRSKIEALMLNRWIEDSDIVISEEFGSSKPSEANYRFFMDKYPNATYSYIGDNTKKDFISPNKLGWCSICLIDSGDNIHKQSFEIEADYLPQYRVDSLVEIFEII